MHAILFESQEAPYAEQSYSLLNGYNAERCLFTISDQSRNCVSREICRHEIYQSSIFNSVNWLNCEIRLNVKEWQIKEMVKVKWTKPRTLTKFCTST